MRFEKTGSIHFEPTRAVNMRTDAYDVRIDRLTIWGNPYRIGVDGTRAEVIAKYETWVRGNRRLMDLLPTLRGKRLGCHCKPADCHGDVLARLADDGEGET